MKRLTLYGLLCCIVSLQNCFAATMNDITTPAQAETVYNLKCPRVVEFYRPSCPHCQMAMPIYNAVAKECTNGTRFYKVNSDDFVKATTIAKKVTGDNSMGLRGVPTFVFLDKNGNKKDVHVGKMSKNDFNQAINNIQ